MAGNNGRDDRRFARLERVLLRVVKEQRRTNERIDRLSARVDALATHVDALPKAMAEALVAVLAPQFEFLNKRIDSIETKVSAIYLAVHRGGGNNRPK